MLSPGMIWRTQDSSTRRAGFAVVSSRPARLLVAPKCRQAKICSIEIGRLRIGISVVDATPVIDLFAGAGGLGIGAKAAGADVRLSVDIDRLSCETMRLNPRSPVVLFLRLTSPG